MNGQDVKEGKTAFVKVMDGRRHTGTILKYATNAVPPVVVVAWNVPFPASVKTVSGMSLECLDSLQPYEEPKDEETILRDIIKAEVLEEVAVQILYLNNSIRGRATTEESVTLNDCLVHNLRERAKELRR